MNSTLRDLQDQVARWASRNFPDAKPYQPLLGAFEELGELSHAHLKMEQGIRGTYTCHHKKKMDAVADCIIFLAHYCELNAIDLDSAVWLTWAEVRKRNWQKDPQGGGEG